MSLSGKTYWLLGASDGLGRALALALDREGARVVVSARSADRLAVLAAAMQAGQALPVDVGDLAAVEAAAADLPVLDGVIYCVGQYQPMRAQEWNTAAALAMCDANFTGAVRVLGQVLPGFVARGSGHVVLIGSLAGFRGLPGAIGYGASKSALMHLAETLRADLDPARIKVQLFNPGFIRTRLTEKNSFRMPQLMAPEAAAEVILRGMKGRRFQTSFPAPFAWMFRYSKFLPDWLYYRLIRQG